MRMRVSAEGRVRLTTHRHSPSPRQNVKHYEWKQTLARPAVGVPGAFYPDERFLRLHSLKQGLDTPTTYQEVVQQAVHLLNSVTIPAGEIMGTDSGAGEGAGDHTIFGLVYDHGAGEVSFKQTRMPTPPSRASTLRASTLTLAPPSLSSP